MLQNKLKRSARIPNSWWQLLPWCLLENLICHELKYFLLIVPRIWIFLCGNPITRCLSYLTLFLFLQFLVRWISHSGTLSGSWSGMRRYPGVRSTRELRVPARSYRATLSKQGTDLGWTISNSFWAAGRRFAQGLRFRLHAGRCFARSTRVQVQVACWGDDSKTIVVMG